MNLSRACRLIESAIETFGLNLCGLRVLTEAATGYYGFTPLIAAMAGADRVYALTRDSRHGTAGEAQSHVTRLAQHWNVADRIEVVRDRSDTRISLADIVTNLGFVRPLNAELLRRLKSTAVIPLMWEAWEYRPEDLDLEECRRLGIPVLGTKENHPDLQIISYIGHLALKLLYQVEVEVFRSTVVVIGSGEFAEVVLATLRSAGAQVAWVDSHAAGTLNAPASQQALQLADAVIVAEHHSRRLLIAPHGELTAEALWALNASLAVVHICGGVDRVSLDMAGLRCWPERFAPPGYMSVATDYLGPRPLIDLHTAGLKIGEMAVRANRSGKVQASAFNYAGLAQQIV